MPQVTSSQGSQGSVAPIVFEPPVPVAGEELCVKGYVVEVTIYLDGTVLASGAGPPTPVKVCVVLPADAGGKTLTVQYHKNGDTKQAQLEVV